MNKENFGDYRIDYSKDNPVLYEILIYEAIKGAWDKAIKAWNRRVNE